VLFPDPLVPLTEITNAVLPGRVPSSVVVMSGGAEAAVAVQQLAVDPGNPILEQDADQVGCVAF
jgi:hypothetical protein